jgi:glycerate 2-kinase
MAQPLQQLRADAIRIWMAGLDAVRSERLVRDALHAEGHELVVRSGINASQQPLRIDLNAVRRIAVVGAGKAGAGMAAALEQILGPALIEQKQLAGWVNVPADCVKKLERIHLHAARPAGVNEPTAEGVAGTAEILRIVESLGPDDLCLALISGGASALMPAPIDGISLADKLSVTQFLSAAAANIVELNTVRKQLSRIKGGGLARACRAGRLVTLVISDILGDPLDLIGSGPTVADSSTPQEALAILEKYSAQNGGVSAAVFDVLRRKSPDASSVVDSPRVQNVIIGNNAMAVAAAGKEAERLGYITTTAPAPRPEGHVEPIGCHLADMAVHRCATAGKKCLVSGGEGTVKLAPAAERGLGGRNQQTALAALVRLAETSGAEGSADRLVVLSAATDGEDGPTDAAGAFIDREVIEEAKRRGLDAADFLHRNDAYSFFEPLGALIKTGPTNTNVCDVRVVLTG